MKFLTFDIEGTARSAYPERFKAWPFGPKNEIVLIGFHDGASACGSFHKPQKHLGAQWQGASYDIAVGQACKYDLHMFRKHTPHAYEFMVKLPLWDTQVAEYVLTGQQAQMISLDELAKKYGGTQKNPDVVKAFEEGKGSDDLEAVVLENYLNDDLLNQSLVAKAQMAACSPKQFRLILQMGEALKCAAEMEWNGFNVNQDTLKDLIESTLVKTLELRTEILNLIVETLKLEYHIDVPATAININSRELWSFLIYGGEYTFTWKVADGFYKTGFKAGTPKLKNVYEKVVKPISSFGTPTKKPGVKVVDESVLARNSYPPCRMYLDYKKKDKLLNTYLINIEANSQAAYDGRLHHNLNMCVAANARLSCQDPNMQNVPTEEKELRSCFNSRWGAKGRIIEIDYKALEMIGFATVNLDPVLIDDLNSGRDPHLETGKEVFGDRPMSDTERRQVKAVNFGTIYGGGADAVAENAEVDITLCKMIQKALRSRYKIGFDAAKARVGMNVIEPMPTGRKYVVDGGYTKTMNYPVSGFSTGDLVPTVMGVLWQRLRESDLANSCLLINQEHDKIILDCQYFVLDAAIRFVKAIMESAPEIMKEIYGIDMPCRTPVAVKVGLDMGHMTPYKVV